MEASVFSLSNLCQSFVGMKGLLFLQAIINIYFSTSGKLICSRIRSGWALCALPYRDGKLRHAYFPSAWWKDPRLFQPTEIQSAQRQADGPSPGGTNPATVANCSPVSSSSVVLVAKWYDAGASPQQFERGGRRRVVRRMREPMRGLGGPAR